MIKVHITDDHVMFMELLIPVINASNFARVVGYSSKLQQCRKALMSDTPDVLLLDINMTDGSGIMFCSEVHKLYPKLKIIALTGHDEFSCIANMLRNGASGYIAKSEAVSEILDGIRTVMEGEQYISNEIKQVIRKTTRKAVLLSLRETETLQLVAKGLSDPQIAEIMDVALSTVLSFEKKLRLKLGVKNRVELVEKARKDGLIE